MANAQVIIDMEEYQKLKLSDTTLNKIWENLSKTELERNVVTGEFYHTIAPNALDKIYNFAYVWSLEYFKKEEKK